MKRSPMIAIFAILLSPALIRFLFEPLAGVSGSVIRLSSSSAGG
jgi:hypothetical protein